MSDHALDQIVAGVDVSSDRIELTLIGWRRDGGQPPVLRIASTAAPAVRFDVKERFLSCRHIDAARDIVICTRTTRRAARRARGRDHGARGARAAIAVADGVDRYPT